MHNRLLSASLPFADSSSVLACSILLVKPLAIRKGLVLADERGNVDTWNCSAAVGPRSRQSRHREVLALLATAFWRHATWVPRKFFRISGYELRRGFVSQDFRKTNGQFRLLENYFRTRTDATRQGPLAAWTDCHVSGTTIPLRPLMT